MSDTENKSTEQRRKALKKLLAGTGAAGVVASAPEKWTAPVINSVSLPAHAQTSDDVPLNFTQMDIALAPGGLQEMLIPTAHAGFTSLNGGSVCINFNADKTTYSARMSWGNPATAEATGTGGTIGTPLVLQYVCGDQVGLEITVDSGPSTDGIPYTLCHVGGSNCLSDTFAMPGECSTESEGCPGNSTTSNPGTTLFN